MQETSSRRRFLTSAAAIAGTFAAAAAVVGPTAGALAADAAAAPAAPKPKLKKAVKFGMIKTDGSIKSKFELVKKLGFQGVEFDSPADIDRAEAVAAQQDTLIQIHGVIDSVHWKDRLSDPDEKVRERGVEALKTAI